MTRRRQRASAPDGRRFGRAAVALGLFLASACATSTPAGPSVTDGALNRRYEIGRSDTLEIIVWDEEKLSGPVPVRPDGMVTVALIGDVPAAGRNPDELADEIRDRLRKYVDEPNVVVRVLATGSRRFFVLGNVRAPGAYEMTAGQTLLQALAMAGGLNEFADSGGLRIIRQNTDTPTLPDYRAITRGETPDVRLQPDDTIVVP